MSELPAPNVFGDLDRRPQEFTLGGFFRGDYVKVSTDPSYAPGERPLLERGTIDKLVYTLGCNWARITDGTQRAWVQTEWLRFLGRDDPPDADDLSTFGDGP